MDPSDVNQENLKKILKENIMKRLFENIDVNSKETISISDEQIEIVGEEEIKALLSSLDKEMNAMIQNQIKQNEDMKLNQRIIESKIKMINQYID